MDSSQSVVDKIMAVLNATELAISDPHQTRIDTAMAKGRRRRRTQAFGVVALVLGLSAGILLPLALLSPLRESETNGVPGATVGRAPHLRKLPQGWSAVQRNEPLGELVLAANFGLPVNATASSVAGMMPETGIVLAVQQVTSACPCTGFRPTPLPLRVEESDVRGFGRHSTVSLALEVDSEFLVIYAELGKAEPSVDQLNDVNRVLGEFTFDAGPSTSDLDPSAELPPTFAGPSLSVATTVAYPQGEWAPITWASTSPFSAADLLSVARTGVLPFRPEKTLAELASSDFVIVGTYVAADPTTGSGPNVNFPDRELPLQLTDAEVRHTWEGQVDPQIPEYVIWAATDSRLLDVRLYFGSLQPSADVTAEAQEALNSMTLN